MAGKLAGKMVGKRERLAGKRVHAPDVDLASFALVRMTRGTRVGMAAGKRSAQVNTAVEVRTRPPGTYGAGNGLYLVVNAPSSNNPKGARQWLFRFTSPVTSRRREMGLGPAGEGGLSLAEAREKATDLRRMIREGFDPIETQRSEKEAERASAASAPYRTFGAFAEKWMDHNLDEFRNPKHRDQWRMTIREYARPLAAKDLDEITPSDVLDVLKPIWTSKPETAKRTQGRIERIMGAAIAEGLRTGDNPASWQGRLKHILPRRQKLSRGHHAALPYKDLPAFVAKLREREGLAARALEFLILTAARSGEVRGATWTEIDLEARMWIIPASRMKVGKQHRVPLCDRALAILQEVAQEHGQEGLVFPGAREDRSGPKPMSDMTLAAVLKRMGYKSTSGSDNEVDGPGRRTQGITVHGFRSAFRDWAEDVAGFPHGAIEAALAHTIPNKSEAAYCRGDAFETRARLMTEWQAYADGGEAGASNDSIAA